MRLIIKILSMQIMDELYFSNNLTIEENIALYIKLKGIVISDYLVLLERNNCLLDIKMNSISLNLFDGDVLYVYA